MLLRLLKSNHNAGLLLFPLIILGYCAYQLNTPDRSVSVTEVHTSLLFGPLNNFLDQYSVIKTLLTSLIIFIAGTRMYSIYHKFLFPSSRSYMPAVLFILITVSLPQYGVFHPVWIAAVFLLLGLNSLFSAYDVRQPFRNMFETGFFLSLGSLFYFNMIFLLPVFVIGAGMMARDVRWREYFLVVLGGFVSWMLMFSAGFLTDQISGLLDWISGSFSDHNGNPLKNIPLLSYLAFLVFLVIAGSVTIIRQYGERKIKFRRYFYFLFWFFFSVILVFFLVPGASSEIFIIAIIPVSFLLSNYFESMKKFFFGEIMFMMIIGFAVYLRFFN